MTAKEMQAPIPFSIDQIFTVFQEKIEDHGEDSLFAACGATMSAIAVFDGCGGSGAKRYQTTAGLCKGAYFASRIACGALHDWFQRYDSCSIRDEETLAMGLKEYISSALRVCMENVTEECSKVRSSMLRDFPTTSAIAIVIPQEKRLMTAWTGDSRLYLLDDNGLAQLSSDDSNGGWGDGGVMHNVICADQPFHINTACYDLTAPCLILSATDGAYAYFHTPLEFEWIVLDTLMKAQTPEVFEQNLRRHFLERKHPDDVTLVMLSLGFGDYEMTRKRLVPRYRVLQRDYISQLDIVEPEELERRYKMGYCRFLEARKHEEG